jgi:5'-nucleotidase (lipoprotein e(P4) family)
VTRMSAGPVLGMLVLVAACASAPPAAPAPQAPAEAPAPTATDAIPRDVHWVRSAAEHRALFLQTYRAATDRVRVLAAGRAGGSWAVIMDADETVLDNSEYQRRIARRGELFDPATWNDWVREQVADSLPGAGAFIRAVRELGGRVAIVTNRDEVVCDETRANLDGLAIRVDVVLCQAPGESGKSARFEAVQRGTTPAGLPPLDVVMFVGDNIHDFPGADLARFGDTWFVLPNPMYGSWERNPPR